LPVAKFFNTSGQSYREGNFKAKLASMSDADALGALAEDGKLIKRPLVFGDGFVLVGFREADYRAAL
jgi:arsenate reductase